NHANIHNTSYPNLLVPRHAFTFLFLSSRRAHRALHSFPTRRSSDLRPCGSPPATTSSSASSTRSSPSPSAPPTATPGPRWAAPRDRKSTRLNSSHVANSYAGLCLKKKLARRAPSQPPTSEQPIVSVR